MSTEKNTTWFININLNYSLLRINNTQMSKMSPQVKWLLAKDNPIEEQGEQQTRKGQGRAD